jgi:predicted N-acetyltransferase YhbS
VRLREETRVGLDHLSAVTALLQRNRRAHPTAGLYEAADLQWWWRTARRTDHVPQLFWFDDDGPAAAAVTVDWGDWTALVPIVLPGATPDRLVQVVERGLAHAGEHGLDALRLEVDRGDDLLAEVLAGHGFAVVEDGVVETWLDAAHRPARSPLPEGYRLSSRADAPQHAYHLARRNQPDAEARLRQTSLYRADLDLVVHDDRGEVAAYGLFWHDPETGTGLVEPMRTEDAHQRVGLARHVLTTGLDLLAAAGATRTKICYEPGNPAAKALYLGVGFEPDRDTVVHARGDGGTRSGGAGVPV